MKIIETEYWCLMLPPEWSAEQSDDVVVITDQDGIGELAVTTLIQDDASVVRPLLQRWRRRNPPKWPTGPQLRWAFCGSDGLV